MIERERRFLVASSPGSFPDASRIVQGYLTTAPLSVRIRRSEGLHTLTIKAGSGMKRTEIERALTADEFDALWPYAVELRIDKRRHLIPLPGGHTAELDLFDGELAGRRLVEVEFESDDAALTFEPPAWFGREVTNDHRYSNSSLARHGWPDEP